MENLQLLELFRSHIQRYETHELLASRANEYTDRFDASVVQRVVGDHTERAVAAGSQAVLLYADMEELVTKLSRECEDLRTSQQAPRSTLDELELRLLIGEIDDGRYENETKPLMSYLEDCNTKIQALEQTVLELSEPMNHWMEISRASSLMP